MSLPWRQSRTPDRRSCHRYQHQMPEVAQTSLCEREREHWPKRETRMSTNGTKTRLLIKLATITIGFTLGIAASYLWLLPAFSNGHKTFYVLVIGLFAAYLSSAYIGYSFFSTTAVARKIISGIVCGLGITVIVLYSSMFIIFKFRGQ